MSLRTHHVLGTRGPPESSSGHSGQGPAARRSPPRFRGPGEPQRLLVGTSAQTPVLGRRGPGSGRALAWTGRGASAPFSSVRDRQPGLSATSHHTQVAAPSGSAKQA